MKIKNRQEFLVALTVAAVALFVGVNFIFTPLQGWWSTRQKEIKTLTARVKDGRVMVAREQVIRGHWGEMRTNSLPTSMSDAEQEFLVALESWSRDSGAVITSIMPQWKVDGTNYMTLNCRVESDGDLSTLSRFIYNIEKGPMMVRLDAVELSSHDTTGQELTLGLEINALALVDNNRK